MKQQLYLLVSNDNPYNPYIQGTFEQEGYIPVVLDTESSKQIPGYTIVTFPEEYNIGWTGLYEDYHIENFVKGESIYVRPEVVSNVPVGELLLPANAPSKAVESIVQTCAQINNLLNQVDAKREWLEETMMEYYGQDAFDALEADAMKHRALHDPNSIHTVAGYRLDHVQTILDDYDINRSERF